MPTPAPADAGSAQIGPFSDYLSLAAIQLVSTLVVFFFYKFYHRRHAASTIDEFYRIFGAVSVATLLTIAFIGFALRDTLEYQRSMIVYAWAASLVTITWPLPLRALAALAAAARARRWSGC